MNIFDDYEKRRQEVKRYAKEKNVPLYKLAMKIGINDGNLSRRLRKLNESQVFELCKKIDEINMI